MFTFCFSLKGNLHVIGNLHQLPALIWKYSVMKIFVAILCGLFSNFFDLASIFSIIRLLNRFVKTVFVYFADINGYRTDNRNFGQKIGSFLVFITIQNSVMIPKPIEIIFQKFMFEIYSKKDQCRNNKFQ